MNSEFLTILSRRCRFSRPTANFSGTYTRTRHGKKEIVRKGKSNNNIRDAALAGATLTGLGLLAILAAKKNPHLAEEIKPSTSYSYSPRRSSPPPPKLTEVEPAIIEPPKLKSRRVESGENLPMSAKTISNKKIDWLH